MHGQLFILALIFGLFAYEATLPPYPAPLPDPPHEGLTLAAIVLLPKLVLGLSFWLICRVVLARLHGPKGGRWLARLDRAGMLYRYGILASYGADLTSGLPLVIRHGLGMRQMVLVDDLMILALPLLMLIWGWWAYYPVERRLREAALMRQIDSGGPVYPIITRSQYLLSQLRHQIALLALPMLALLGWIQLVPRLVPADATVLGMGGQVLAVLGGLGAIFLTAPLIVRLIWDTEPLPPGELRDRLIAMCRQHGVRIRQVLLWRTFGSMINGAVIGITRHLRYILLTDALLDAMPRRRIEAVMAHELGHIRLRHIPWMLLVAIAMLAMVNVAAYQVSISLHHWAHATATVPAWLSWMRDPTLVQLGPLVAAVIGWIVIFGWVSRRFERQADTFAVCHLARTHPDPAVAASGRITAEAVDAMAGALQDVADLNFIPTHRRSWRHGSIHWRQQYLRSLTGTNQNDLAIDRVVRLIKIAGVAAVGLLIASYLWNVGMPPVGP